LTEGGELSALKPDTNENWSSQVKAIRQRLIPAITKKLPGYKQHSGTIEKILQQHHKMQKRTATINASPTLKEHNRARMNKNTRVNEVSLI
jgi:hypothetical protein